MEDEGKIKYPAHSFVTRDVHKRAYRQDVVIAT